MKNTAAINGLKAQREALNRIQEKWIGNEKKSEGGNGGGGLLEVYLKSVRKD